MWQRFLAMLNIRPDANQKWTLSSLFVSGLLYAYISPTMTKEIVTALPAEWLAFQGLFGCLSGFVFGMLWQGKFRNAAIKFFAPLCIAECTIGFLTAIYLRFIEYNVWIFAISTLLYSSLVSIFVAKCIMVFRTKLWNEREREVYDNNNSIVQNIYGILGLCFSLFFLPSLNTALIIWGVVCLVDDAGWLIVYSKNRNLLKEN